MKYLFGIFAVAVATMLFVPVTTAQEGATGNVAMHVALTPKAGHGAQFFGAIKSHIEWRAENGDPWQWNAYGMENGDNLETIHFRSIGHKFEDIETYNAGEFNGRAEEHYLATVAPHVATTEVVIDRLMREISAWPQENDHPLIQLYGFQIDPAKYGQWRRAIGRIHSILQDNGWPQGYAFIETVSGGSVHYKVLAIPMRGWGDLDEGRDPHAFVANAVGEEEANSLWADFYDAVEREDTWAVRRIPDLSLTRAQTASAQ